MKNSPAKVAADDAERARDLLIDQLIECATACAAQRLTYQTHVSEHDDPFPEELIERFQTVERESLMDLARDLVAADEAYHKAVDRELREPMQHRPLSPRESKEIVDRAAVDGLRDPDDKDPKRKH
jgi:hypothetical protein